MYEIKGIPPEYRAPEGKASVGSYMDRNITAKLGKVSTKKNFLRSNMNVAKTVNEDRRRRGLSSKTASRRRRK